VIDEMTGRPPFLQGYHCGWSTWSRTHHTSFLPIPHIQSILMSPRLARLAHLLVRPGKMGKGIQPWVQSRTTKTATAAGNSSINQRLFNTNSQTPSSTTRTSTRDRKARSAVCVSSINLSCRNRRGAGIPPHMRACESARRPSQSKSSQRKLRLSANNNRCSPFCLVSILFGSEEDLRKSL
jgi:hypothetical protein